MQTLDQSKSYYRRITTLDIVTILMIIGLLFFTNGFLLSLLLIVVYPFSHSKVLVSDIGDKNTKIWVRKMDWDVYRKEHRLGPVMQYKSRSTVDMKQA
ncbi:hypothetical protein [Companilactobacillus nantensis]|uniref:Uncharacterized protein n=1 Tax=Companilactobacillus nantensis DSM 16982 TaxID=1423774 RepID=A0A0R1WDP1_9LACO|nr:hypothetical protein [Companilactobacillus nantensis]KRM16078.1 hypothetical protein FD31_GL000753 [Companilactobacillus nantensis DSM 16982]GEO63868.1 hypothetical protein LNA01_10510 [Companilactobacillus nantensis]